MHNGPDAPVVRLRWYYTSLKFPPVGTPRVILNRKLDQDQESELSVGQLPITRSRYKQDARWVQPAGLKGLHQCHPEWLATGEPWPNDLPPTVYNNEQVPVCCFPGQDVTFGGLMMGGAVGDNFKPYNVLGGLALGGSIASTLEYVNGAAGGLAMGTAVGDLFTIQDALAGGLELGGAAGDVAGLVDALAGGLELGGEAGDIGTQTVTPGTACLTATAVVQDQQYFRLGGPGATPHWYVYGLANGTYTFYWNDNPSVFHSLCTVFTGASCAALGVGTPVARNSPTTITVTNAIAFVRFTQGGPGQTSSFYIFKMT